MYLTQMQFAFLSRTLPLHAASRSRARKRAICTVKDKPVNAGMRLLEAPNAFGVLVRTARLGWTTAWRLMMAELAPSSKGGAYVRPHSTLNAVENFVNVTSLTLYEGVACGWCHRTMLARALLQLDDVKTVRVTPGDDGLWQLPDGRRLRDVYPTSYRGRYTAPLLIDSTGSAVCNESALILQVFHERAGRKNIDEDVYVCLQPSDTNLSERIYSDVNDGVYRCGFATSQTAYEKAEKQLFATLDHCEQLLEKSRFLCSPDTITEADIRLFPTVWRFDAVYAHLFRVRRKSINTDYPNISAWLKDIYRLPGVADTCDLDATRKNYYQNLFPLNPGGIVPIPPPLDMTPTVDRSGLGKESKVVQ